MAEVRDTISAAGGDSLLAQQIADFAAQLATQVRATDAGARLSDGDRIDLIAALEALKGTAAAVQARHIVDLDASVRARHAELGLPKARGARTGRAGPPGVPTPGRDPSGHGQGTGRPDAAHPGPAGRR
jgi:hypothetical protein